MEVVKDEVVEVDDEVLLAVEVLEVDELTKDSGDERRGIEVTTLTKMIKLVVGNIIIILESKETL